MEGQRVELNAMTSDQFVAFVEDKLTETGIAKVVPPKDQLDGAYRLFARSKRVKAVVEEAILALDDDEIGIPYDLEDLVRDYLAEQSRHALGGRGAACGGQRAVTAIPLLLALAQGRKPPLRRAPRVRPKEITLHMAVAKVALTAIDQWDCLRIKVGVRA
jgi:hypothetical protein